MKGFKVNNNKIVGGSSSRTNETVGNLFKNNKSKKSMYMQNIGATREPTFLIPNAKKAFNQLQLAFIKVPIF